ncbi:carbonic anhydrase [Naematelia encephala]|uniref:Carbonic anhydrase n=1 Tax=Naematelia encephala TaxID=71784 RepID=A0A1Y2BAV0_9TREE|nr:carbonic anhydrase [Naematelia encephala]
MSKALEYSLHCNTAYSVSADSPIHTLRPDPGPPPTAQIAIITCMDARLDVFRMFGLKLGEAHIIRVGGGRAPDALRSVIASEHVLATNEIMVVHHTDCGFTKAPSEGIVRDEVRASLGGLSVEHINFMPITQGFEKSVGDDVEFLRKCPYIKDGAKISGWLYDTAKGTIEEIRC